VLDGYDVHDIYFSWAPQDSFLEGLQVDLALENVFDESYERVYADVVEPGRNFRIGASYSLNF